MAKGEYKIPFDEDGNQLDYDYSWGSGFDMRDNHVFQDTLVFKEYGRGRSSITFTMKRQSAGTTVSVFVSDFADMLPFMVNGQITGKFTFVKKGSNFGCKFLET